MASNIGRGTEKIYYEDAYRKSFEATVLSCQKLCQKGDPEGPARYAVVLDRTAFFPEEGGQCPDHGTIRLAEKPGEKQEAGHEEANVLDVQIREGVITHTLDRAFPEGSLICGEVDFDYRFSNMQQHSAEHLMSGLVHSRLGLNNVGFHLSDSEVTTDYDGPVRAEILSELEDEVNRAIWKNIKTQILYPSEEELAGIDYRSKIEIDGQVRLVVYPGYDVCACCAPHVARTGEIGIFKVIAAQNYKGGTRVFMLAGARALEFLKKEHEQLNKTARFLSTQTDLVPERVENMKQEITDLRHALSEAEAAQLAERIRMIPASQKDVCLFTQGLDTNVIRKAVNTLMEEHSGICAVFDGDETDGYRYIMASQDGVRLNAVQNEMRTSLAARGGGKPPMMQGSVTAAAKEIETLIIGTERL